MKPIDIVVPYVNCWDTEWQKLAAKHVGWIEYNRVRDLGTLRYFFRGVEFNMSWIHNVYLVVQSESQIPSWLNREHPKLKIVYHKDYIPKKFLPTFNSNVIELFYHKIKGLTNHFILANDDTVAIRPLDSSDFFCDNNIVYGPGNRIENCVFRHTDNVYINTVKNTSRVAGIITGNHNMPLYPDFHLFMPELKSVYKKCWREYKRGIIHSIKYSKARNDKNITHLLFYFVTREIGLYKCNDGYKPGLVNISDGMPADKIINAFLNAESNICCLNDDYLLTSDSDAKRTIQAALNYFLPGKSTFELI